MPNRVSRYASDGRVRLVSKLTAGTMTIPASIAHAPLVGAKLISPVTSGGNRESKAPQMTPANAPALVTPLQSNPYRNGARNAPAMVPQESDISDIIGVFCNRKLMASDSTTKPTQSKRMAINRTGKGNLLKSRRNAEDKSVKSG